VFNQSSVPYDSIIAAKPYSTAHSEANAMIPRFTDHAANERTYLAWVRTAITVMAFGFLLERFDIFLSYASRMGGQSIPNLHIRASEWLGLMLLLFGALIVLFATLRFYRNGKLINSEETHPYGGMLFERLMAGGLIAMAIFLIVYVAHQILALS
jgi:inner membrane protein YidH